MKQMIKYQQFQSYVTHKKCVRVSPEDCFGCYYLLMYIVQQTQIKVLAHHFILFGIAYNGEMS
jgi:hypothetical protein